MTSSSTNRSYANKASLLVLFLFFMGISASHAQNSSHHKTDELIGAMELSEGDWAADVGSGDGDYTGPIIKAVGTTGHVFAVDIDTGELADLNEKVKKHNETEEKPDIENITTVYSIETDPMLPANSIDAVLVRNAYHHFSAHQSMLRNIKTALKPGGRLVIEESIQDDMVGKSREEQIEQHDLGIKYVREELKAAGFTIHDEINPLSDRDGHFHWVIVATRPES